MLQHLDLPTLQQLRQHSKIIMLYRITHKLASIPTATYIAPSTRNTQHYILPYARTHVFKIPHVGGAVAEWVRALACAGDRTVLAGFESHCGKLRFGTLAIPFTPLCQCLSEETLKAVGPFYLVSMPGEVKDPTSPHWNV